VFIVAGVIIASSPGPEEPSCYPEDYEYKKKMMVPSQPKWNEKKKGCEAPGGRGAE
jgi:hypothetical protein